MGISLFHIHKDRFMFIADTTNKHEINDTIAELFYYLEMDIDYFIKSINAYIETEHELYDTYCKIRELFDWYPEPITILRVPDTMMFILALQNYINHENKMNIRLYDYN